MHCGLSSTVMLKAKSLATWHHLVTLLDCGVCFLEHPVVQHGTASCVRTCTILHLLLRKVHEWYGMRLKQMHDFSNVMQRH